MNTNGAKMISITGRMALLAIMSLWSCRNEQRPEIDLDDNTSVRSLQPFRLVRGDDPGLERASSCEDVNDCLRQHMLDSMIRRMDREEASLVRSRQRTDCDLIIEWAASPGSGGVGTAPDFAADTAEGMDWGDVDLDADADGDVDGPSEYTGTNLQEADVDEADFVKTDGAYIYVLADGHFQILNAWPPEDAHRISAVPVTGTPKRMFVYGDLAVIYASMAPIPNDDPAFTMAAMSECTYGFDCEMVGDGHPMQISVYDMGDRTAPQLIREVNTNGSLLSARRVDGTVLSAVVFPAPDQDRLLGRLNIEFIPSSLSSYRRSCGDEIPYSVEKIEEIFNEQRLHNRERIAQFDPGSENRPMLVDRRRVGETWEVSDDFFADCSDFWLSASGNGLNQLSLMTFSPDDNKEIDLVSIIGRPGAVYASTSALYIAARQVDSGHGDWFFDNRASVSEATTVHQFDIDANARNAVYRGSGVVKGRVLNQFSMSEKDGFLRIATMTGLSPNPSAHSTLSILESSADGLQTVGQVDQIAPREDTRAVRFIGDRGYVVTYMVQTGDPLFVIDLSDPTQPTILGELHIPGFSTYLHPLGPDHLMTIGYEAENWNSEVQGIALQIIDVRDPTRPLLAHKHVIGSSGTASEAATNHLGFTYSASRGQLAVPMTICDYDNNNEQWGMTFSGLQIYDVSAETGFNLVGGLPHEAPTSGPEYWNACGQFWTRATSSVKRSIFMDDYIYSIAPIRVRNALIDNLEEPLVSIDLTVP